ncbi:transmembrane protein, putative (macronuclear) [Tetrahymena thermophila SB210]|uniref:Transmembrane protein, putative n=1 Tax=Tetrahymena thermophila (strain SB210) TaxID=312017 RepID=Q22AS7_TETTS|nr:transmembrane protein, putative [Tetrahymena thermophila SB210]EAR82391.2 transmembrane protein, putative [Tetrahymena thermophila SB210]|eukprot:XP_001030054.2 transmembrane protein, putative [Tetrahymena thermophila SB210]
MHNQANSQSINFRIIYAFQIIYCFTIFLDMFSGIKQVIAASSSCQASNCQSCDANSPYCKQCIPPFVLNQFGYCDASSVCNQNQYYSTQDNSCEVSCMQNQTPNPVLNFCDQVNACSSTNYLGTNQLPPLINQPIFYDPNIGVYIYPSATNQINIYDSVSMQYQASIFTQMQTIGKCVYDQSTQNVVVTNTQGQIEIWNVLSTDLVFMTTVPVYQGSYIQYIPNYQQFFYLDQNKNLTVINNFSQSPKTLQYQFVNLNLNYVIYNQTQSVVFAGNQLELLHISLNDFSLIFQNSYNFQLPTSNALVYNVASYSSQVFVFYRATPGNNVLIYQPNIQILTNTSQLSLFNGLGYMFGSFFQKVSSQIQFYDLDPVSGNITAKGPLYPLSQNYFIINQNQTIGFGLFQTPSLVSTTPNIKFIFNFTSAAKFTSQMITNITTFNLIIQNTLFMDEVNNRLVNRGADGIIYITDMNYLNVTYSIKQFQQAPVTTFSTGILIQSRPDPLNLPGVITTTMNSLQNINLVNNKRRIKSLFANSNMVVMQTTKNIVVTIQGSSFTIYKISNMQKLNTQAVATSIDTITKCPNPLFMIQTQTTQDDFITVCKSKLVYWQYNSVNQNYNAPAIQIAVQNPSFIVKDMLNHIIICYATACNAHLKSSLVAQIININTQGSNIFALNTRSDQTFFTILVNSSPNSVLFISYPQFALLATAQLLGNCTLFIGAGYFENNRAVFVCRPDLVSFQVNFHILTLNIGTPTTVQVQSMSIPRLITTLNIFDSQTVFTFYASGNNIYFYMYAFQTSLPLVIEKAASLLPYTYNSPAPNFDTVLRRVFFTFNNNIFYNTQFVGEYQIWSYSYNNHYYDILDNGNVNQIQKIKQCVYNSYVVGVQRPQYVYISDNLRNIEYKQTIQGVTDFYIDSSIQTFFYVNGTKIISAFNYVTNTQYSYTHTAIMTNLSSIANPKFQNTFVAFNNINTDFTLCSYNQASINCFNKTLSTNIYNYVTSVVCTQNVAFVYDNSSTYYYIIMDPTQTKQPIYISLSQPTSANVALFVPQFGFLVTQSNTIIGNGYISNLNGYTLTTLTYTCFIQDIIAYQNGYFILCPKLVYAVSSVFAQLFQFGTAMTIQKAYYYSPKNLLIIISNQQGYTNLLTFYDVGSQLQLQSIQLGNNQLSNIQYFQEEDIFVIYSLFGQIFRIDLNQPSQQDFIVNVLEPDTGSLTQSYFPTLFYSRQLNKLFFASQTNFHKWNYSPFIGTRLNYKIVRYLQYQSAQNKAVSDTIYYADLSSFVWVFQNGQQQLIQVMPNEVQDMYTSPTYLVIFTLQNIYVYQISDFSNTLLINNAITTTTIQFSMQFNVQVYAYITSDYDFFLYDLSTNQYQTPPVKIATFAGQVIDFVLIASDTALISLYGLPPVLYKVGFSSFTTLTGAPNLQTFLGAYTIASLSNIIIIEMRNIISINSQTLAFVNQISFPENDSAGFIESYVFDDQLGLLFIHYQFHNYVQVIPYSLNKAQLTFIGSPDIYRVKFLVQSTYIAIYCSFQINFHSRDQNLNYLYSFRMPTIVNSTNSLIILNDAYLVITQRSQINIFIINPVQGSSPTFTSYKTIYSTQSTIYQAFIDNNRNIKLQGVGQEGYFNNIIVVGFQCQQQFSSVKNKLNLKSQLNSVSIVTENVQKYYYFNIQLDSSTKYSQLPFINEISFSNNNAVIQYIPQQQDQQLTLSNNIFSSVSTIDLVINNFRLMIPDGSNNISFNPQTQVVIIKQVTINQDLNNVIFNFSNLQRVVIDQLTITDLTITDSVLFNFINVGQVTISNLNLINVNFIRSQLIYIRNSNSISIINLQIQSLRIYQYVGKMIINICSSQKLQFQNLFVSDVTGTNVATTQDISTITQVIERDYTYLQQQVNNIIYLQKVQYINMSVGSCQLLKQIQLIKIEDFYNDGSLQQTLISSFVQFDQVNFKTNQGMFSLVSIKASNVTLNLINAQQNSCSDCNGAVFFIYETKYLSISSSIFNTNYAIHGGSLSIQSCNDVYNYFQNNTFLNNQARGNGGAVYLDNCDLNINTTNFTRNTAIIGGAIRYVNLVPMFINGINDILNSITFSKNNATIFGNNYGSYFSSIKLINLQNSQLNSTYITSNNTFQTFDVSNFQSGNDIIFYLQIQDEEQEIVSYDPQSLISSRIIPSSIKQSFQKIIFNLVSSEDQILIEGSTFATYQQFDKNKQLFIFSQCQLIAQPLKVGTLFVQTNVDFQIPDYILDKLTQEAQSIQNRRVLQKANSMRQTINSNQFSITINFQFRDCQVGEIYQNISSTKTSCYICPTGSYSLVTPNYYEKQTCNQCSNENTQQCGNSTIILKSGYWRKSQSSDVIVECINKVDNCIDDSSARGYCKEGLIGPLCENCDVLGEVWGKPYSQTLQYQCAPCTDYFSTYVRWGLLFLAVNIYILGTLWIFFGIYRQRSIIYYLRQAGMIAFGNSARRDQSSTYLKFLITYAQLQSNINQFKYDIFVLSIPTMFGQPVSQLNTATDCQIVSYQNKLLVKTAAMLCLPILFYLWICLVFFVKSIFVKRGRDYWFYSRMKLFTLFLFSFTLFQPNIVSFLIQSVSCRVIGDVKYVTADITMICYEMEHIYVIFISIFGILLWVVIVPVYIFVKLKRIQHTEWITKQYCYGFLYLEFNKKNKYWELVRLQLKLLIIIFINLLMLNPVTQFTCITFTLLIYYHLIHKYMPYETLHMNQNDKLMIISLGIQLILNAIIKDTSIGSNINLIITLICMSINVVTFCYLILVILLQKIQFIRQNIIKFKYMLQQIPCLKNVSFLQVVLEVETSFRRFQLWKALSKNLQSAIFNCQIMKYKQLRENFLMKSQNLKANKSKNSDTQQIRDSIGFEMMIKELGNSSFPNQFRHTQKQNTNAKYLNNVDQLNITLDGEQTQSPKYTQQGAIHNRIGEDKVNSDFLNSVLGKDSKYIGQNSIPYHHPYSQNKNLKISVSHSNSPLQNSNNSLTAQQLQQTQQTFNLDKASPFKILHNGLFGKNNQNNYNQNSRTSNADISPLDGDNVIIPSNSGASLNHITSTAAISNNLVGNSSISHTQLLTKPKFNTKNQDLEDYKSPPSLSYNTSAIVYPLYPENDEDESKTKFETVGLKQFNSQINPKIISDEQLVNPPNGPRKMSASNSSSEQMEEEDEGVSQKKSIEDSEQLEQYKIQESPNSNLPSQLDRYKFPPDYLMKMSKRSLIQNNNNNN